MNRLRFSTTDNEFLEKVILSWVLTDHLVLGLPFSFSHMSGDNPLRLFSESGVRTELEGKNIRTVVIDGETDVQTHEREFSMTYH